MRVGDCASARIPDPRRFLLGRGPKFLRKFPDETGRTGYGNKKAPGTVAAARTVAKECLLEICSLVRFITLPGPTQFLILGLCEVIRYIIIIIISLPARLIGAGLSGCSTRLCRALSETHAHPAPPLVLTGHVSSISPY